MKIAVLFHTFFPKEALEMETTKEFYECSIEDLMEKIVAKVPEMEGVFREYLEENPEKMELQEVFPGRQVWAITDLGDKVKGSGVWGLMRGISSLQNVVRICKQGSWSTQTRFQSGWPEDGSSSEDDLKSGGGDRAFLRAIKSGFRTTPMRYFFFSGKAQLLINPRILNRGCPYAYLDDTYGAKNKYHRNYDMYRDRTSITEFADYVQVTHTNNEVCVYDISPEFIDGVRVQNQKDADELYDLFKAEGLVNEEDDTILGRPSREFIRVGEYFEEADWRE
jgi:hypothetical protein